MGNINISGSPIIGNIVQGSNNTVSTVISNSQVNEICETTKSAINRLGNEIGITKEEIKKATEYVEELGKSAGKNPTNTDEGSSILKRIKSNAEWAYPIIKDFIAAIWPALSGLV